MQDDLPQETTATILKLLVVDDEKIIRTGLGKLGADLGFEVATAEDGQMGWEVFQDFKPDLVVLDIYMPKINGILLMYKIKEADPNCSVVLITGFLHYEQLVRRSKVRPDGFILKPFRLEMISDMLLRLAEKRQEAMV